MAVLTALMVAAVAYPIVGVVVVYALIWEAVPDFLQPRLPIGGGKLKLYDLAILFMFALVMCSAIVKRQDWWHSLRAFRWPLIYVFTAYAISVVYVKIFEPNALYLAEARNAVEWLLLPMTLLVAQTRRRQQHLICGITIVVLLIALFQVLQSVMGWRIMTGSRVEALDSRANFDIVRSIAGGAIYLVLFVLYLVINRLWERRLSLWLAVPTIVLLSLALAVQFGRGLWLAMIVGLLLSAFYFRGLRGMLKTSVLSLIALSLVFLLVMEFKPRAAEAMVNRFAGIGQEIDSGGSFAWRQFENRAAIEKILQHPFLGVGVGGEYKNHISSSSTFQNETTYIHNAYLLFPLKLGLWAAFVPVAFVLAFLVTIRRYGRNALQDADRGLAAATLGAFVVPLITSFGAPEWADPRGIAAMCFLMTMALHVAQRAESESVQARAALR